MKERLGSRSIIKKFRSHYLSEFFVQIGRVAHGDFSRDWAAQFFVPGKEEAAEKLLHL